MIAQHVGNKRQRKSRLRRLQTLYKLQKSGTAKKTRRNLPVHRVLWADHIATLREGEFARRYRMPKHKFDYLLLQCSQVDKFFLPLTPEQERKTKNTNGSSGLEPEHKLAITLRWLAGGNYLDIRLVHGCSLQTVHDCLWHAC